VNGAKHFALIEFGDVETIRDPEPNQGPLETMMSALKLNIISATIIIINNSSSRRVNLASSRDWKTNFELPGAE
jgi:hypothetical protein